MDWKEISNLSLYTDAERERAKRDNIAINSPPVDHTQLPREILASLRPHYSNWSLQTGNIMIRELRASDTIKLFEKNGKDWIAVKAFSTGSVLGQNAYALSRRSLRAKSNKGGGQGPGSEAGVFVGPADDKLHEQTPTVNITSPSNRAEIELHDKKHTKQDFQNHTFKEGDTVLSVVEELTGRKDSRAIYNYNNPPYSPRRPPQSMDTVRVAVGRSLKVSGTTSNSSSVNLTWTGPTNGSTSIGVPKAGKNEIVGWDAEFKAKAGVYHLTATVAGAKSEIDVALYGYEDEMLVIYYQISANDKQTTKDVVVLSSDDGEWEQTLAVSGLKEDKGWVELAFQKPESTSSLTLTYHQGDANESFVIFEGQSFEHMKQVSAQVEPEIDIVEELVDDRRNQTEPA